MHAKGLVALIALLILSGPVACQNSDTQSGGSAPAASPTPMTVDRTDSEPAAPASPVTGGTIAFHSNRSGDLQIHTLDLETNEVVQLTNTAGGSFEPSWSPDCESLVFASGRDDPNSFALYTMRNDGSEQKRLLTNPGADDWAPAWSPTGDVIAFQTNETGMFQICFVSPNGERLGCYETDSNEALPGWSPDGSKLAFISARDGDWEVFVADVQIASAGVEVTNPVQLTNNDTVDQHPRFSADGEFIVFNSKQDEKYNIHVVRTDGSEERQITMNAEDDVMPNWIGSDRIIYASYMTGDWEIHQIGLNDGRNTQLTNSAGLDKWPVWCEAGE